MNVTYLKVSVSCIRNWSSIKEKVSSNRMLYMELESVFQKKGSRCQDGAKDVLIQ